MSTVEKENKKVIIFFIEIAPFHFSYMSIFRIKFNY